MKRFQRVRVMALRAAMVVAVATLGSCELLESLLGFGNSAPSVTLSADYTTAYSDQIVVFTATASDSDDDELTYTWYWNGEEETSLYESSVSFYWLASSTTSQNIRVVVSDGEDEGSAEVTVTVNAGSSLRIDNHSTSYTVDEIYVATSTSDWGSDIFSGYLYPGYRLRVYDLGSEYYYFMAVNLNNLAWSTGSSYYTSNGYYREWDLYDSSSYMNIQSNVISSVVQGGAIAGRGPTATVESNGSSEVEETTPRFLITPIPVSDVKLAESGGISLHAVKY